jgi:hypothetical protein
MALFANQLDIFHPAEALPTDPVHAIANLRVRE